LNFNDFDDSYFESCLKTNSLRMKMHERDRKWVTHNISLIEKINEVSARTFLDIGCSDGEFLKGFSLGEGCWGIEPNTNMQKVALSNGVRIATSISEISHLDTVILRGVLHHLPDYKQTFGQIVETFTNSKSSNKKVLFLLANPNSESIVYRKFGRLPALEFGLDFASIYKVHGAKEVLRELNLLGFDGSVHYPYLYTPYSNPTKDVISFAESFITEKYRPFPFPRNMFNLVATYRG
jgi:hypothetical protein